MTMTLVPTADQYRTIVDAVLESIIYGFEHIPGQLVDCYTEIADQNGNIIGLTFTGSYERDTEYDRDNNSWSTRSARVWICDVEAIDNDSGRFEDVAIDIDLRKLSRDVENELKYAA